MKSTEVIPVIAACLVIGYVGCAQHKEVVPPKTTTKPSPSAELPAVNAPSTSEPEPVIVTGSKLSRWVNQHAVPRFDIEKRGIRNPSNLVTPSILAYGFPWPPPRASAFDVIPNDFLMGLVEHPTLNDVAKTLDRALFIRDYYARSYYPILDGFAIATHIEQINDDGTSKESGRWSVDVPTLEVFSPQAYLSALFRAPKGHYRVIVFVVITQPFTQTNTTVTRQQATVWLSAGYNNLPGEIRLREFSSDYTCTALIYEFKGTGKDAEFVDPSHLQGRTHLIKSGLMAALSTR